MKKGIIVTLLGLVLVSSLLVFAACSKKSDPTPTPTPTTGTTLTEKTGNRIYNINGTSNKSAFDLVNGVNRVSSDAATDKDMLDNSITSGGSAQVYNSGWKSGNSTLYAKTTSFDYANATISSITSAYTSGTPVGDLKGLVVGNVIIAKIRGLDQYVAIKITAIVNDFNIGAGFNEDYLEFSYKK